MAKREPVIEVIDDRTVEILRSKSPAERLEIDVMVAEDSSFNASRFDRLRPIHLAAGVTAAFASPEDVILKKLEVSREGGSDTHLRDIAGVIRIMGSELDHEYVEAWALRLGLLKLWHTVVEAAESG